MSRNRHRGNIALHIKELVLHGFPRSEQHRIGEAVRQELLRQFSEQGIPDALTRQDGVSRLNAGAIQTIQGARPERVGMQVAQAVYGSVVSEQQPAYGSQTTAPGKPTQMNNGGLIKS